MQNFKQYLLKENESSDNSICSKIKFMMPHNLNMLSAYKGRELIMRQEFNELAKQNGLPEVIKLVFLPSSCMLRHLFFPGRYDKNQIDKLAEQYSELLNSYLKNEVIFDKGSFNPKVIIYDNYDFNVFIDNLREVDFYCNANTTLSKIDKIVNCDIISFINIDFIQGSVLSLLKIPKLEDIYNEDPEDPLWFKIVEAHIQEGKDLLDCQEELYANGLKEYAKL